MTKDEEKWNSFECGCALIKRCTLHGEVRERDERIRELEQRIGAFEKCSEFELEQASTLSQQLKAAQERLAEAILLGEIFRARVAPMALSESSYDTFHDASVKWKEYLAKHSKDSQK